jgi:hypothetical protein
MATYRRLRKPEEEYRAVGKRPETDRTRPLSTEAALPAVYRRATDSAGPLRSTDAGVLQRAVGNRTTAQLLSERTEDQNRAVQLSLDEEEELACPGSKIRSGGQGKGLGFGLGKGPVGEPTEEEWGERNGQGEGTIVEPEEDERG